MPSQKKHLLGVGFAVAAGAVLVYVVGCERPAATAASPAKTDQSRTRPQAQPRTSEAPVGEDKEPVASSQRPAGLPRKPRVLARTFDDIKFDIEPDAPFHREMLTDEIERLNGKRIEIRGYILPGAQSKLRDFVLVRDNQECCFGPGAALYDCILVSMAPGKVADFSVRPVAVKGEFRIEPFEFSGATRAVFRMTAEEVSR